jgi:high-affinity K+ transport system ATPase subunit B
MFKRKESKSRKFLKLMLCSLVISILLGKVSHNDPMFHESAEFLALLILAMGIIPTTIGGILWFYG